MVHSWTTDRRLGDGVAYVAGRQAASEWRAALRRRRERGRTTALTKQRPPSKPHPLLQMLVEKIEEYRPVRRQHAVRAVVHEITQAVHQRLARAGHGVFFDAFLAEQREDRRGRLRREKFAVGI